MNIIKLLDRTIKNKIEYWFKDKDIVIEHKPTVWKNIRKCRNKCIYDKEPNIIRNNVKVYICRRCYHSIHIYKNRSTMRLYEAFLSN